MRAVLALQLKSGFFFFQVFVVFLTVTNAQSSDSAVVIICMYPLFFF